MKIKARNLTVETTRRCNMNCEHCLRGEAENKDISHAVIDAIMDNIDSIGTINFTGGEPSLNVDAISCFRKTAERRNIDISNFYIVTNGRDKVMELSSELLKFNAYCLRNNFYDAEHSGLALSLDGYHSAISAENENLLRGLSFFKEDKIFENEKNRKIINEGRAKDNSIGEGYIYEEKLSIANSYDDIIEIDSNIYINVFGDVVLGCDFSYETQGEVKLGNILDEDLYDILCI